MTPHLRDQPLLSLCEKVSAPTVTVSLHMEILQGHTRDFRQVQHSGISRFHTEAQSWGAKDGVLWVGGVTLSSHSAEAPYTLTWK